VRRHFREDIRNEVVQTLVPRFFADAVKQENLSVVGQPRFEELKFEDGQPLTCRATFEVYPEFELKQYKGLEVEEEPVVVTEADVEQALEEVRQRAATFEVITDRPAMLDDYVFVSYRSINTTQPDDRPVEARDSVVHLGGKGTVAAFTENLLGCRPGEVREFAVSYADDFPQKSLAGRTVSYRVEVQSIKRKNVPPLDDELAKSVSELKTLEELRARLREGLLESQRRRAERATKQKLMEQLLQMHSFPAPQALVEEELDRRIERMVAQLAAQGVDPRAVDIDWQRLREEGRAEAEKQVRTALLLAKVADLEQIEVSEEELDSVIREMAKERGEPPAALKTRLTRSGEEDRIKFARRNQKALELIYQNASITRKPS